MIGGKACFHPPTGTATFKLFWFEPLTNAQVKRQAVQFVRACYFEAEDIELWAVPGDHQAVIATFAVNERKLREDMDRFHPRWEARGISLHNRYTVQED